MGMPDKRPHRITRCQAITDIIESVAKEQAALADILSTQGNKFHKAEEMSAENGEYKHILREVNRNITAVTMLEVVLRAKLDLFHKCLCDDCDVDDDCDTINVDMELEQPNILVKIDKESNTNFKIVSLAYRGSSNIEIITTPNSPISLKSAPPCVSLNGHVLSINWGSVPSTCSVVLTIGTGECQIETTIELKLISF